MVITTILWDKSGVIDNDHPVSMYAMAKMCHEYKVFQMEHEGEMVDITPELLTLHSRSTPTEVLLEEAGLLNLPEFREMGYDAAAARLHDEFIAKVETVCATEKAIPYKGMPQIVQKLAKYGIEQHVMSAHPHKAMVADFRSHGIFGYFQSARGSFDGGKDKRILQVLDGDNREGLVIPKEQAIYIGDSPGDIRAANAAEIAVIGAMHGGYAASKELPEMNPTYLTRTVETLDALLGSATNKW